MNSKEAVGVVRFLLSAYPTQRQKMSEDDIRAMTAAYAVGLEDIEAGAGQAAVSRLVRSSEWLPTVAAIRAAVGVIEHGSQMAGGEAWGAVLRALREQGIHRTPGVEFSFADPVTARIVKALGWRELCTSDNSTADRARFVEAYNATAKTERTEAQAATGATSARLATGDVIEHRALRVPDGQPTDEERAEMAALARSVVQTLSVRKANR